MGAVFHALDHERHQEVALKFLKAIHPVALYRFKREFRAIADLVHPNLVTLYELHTDGHQWCIAMELVDGARNFLEFVRPCPAGQVLQDGSGGACWDSATRMDGGDEATFVDARETLQPTPQPASSPQPWTGRRSAASGELRMERLLDALRQIVDGLSFLHQAGVIHCDIKPGNVLVDRSGRVQICDFGVVQPQASMLGHFIGTPAYASPEQLEGAPLSPASDYYGVGVMLYEALTGILPSGATEWDRLLAAKKGQVLPPCELDPSIDAELSALCASLLHAEARGRPDAQAIRDVLQRRTPRVGVASRLEPVPFVGRRAERAELERALSDSAARGSLAVFVRGPSGVGKSALVRHAVDHWHKAGALILDGRCYENERIPFKALDGVMDELAVKLCMLPREEIAAVLTDEVGALVKLFPMLRRVQAIVERFSAVEEESESLRERAALGLGALLRAASGLGRVVVVVDDLQWGDADSAPLFRALLTRDARPGVLLLCTYRTDAGAEEPVLAESLLCAPPSLERQLEPRCLDLAPLGTEDASALARAILGDEDESCIAHIVREALGSPLFVVELAHAYRSGEVAQLPGGLDALLAQRVRRLEPDARALLTAASLATRPQPMRMLARAAGVSRESRALAQLRAARLLRAEPSPVEELLAPYHDRIREIVAQEAPPADMRQVHRGLAQAIAEEAQQDVEALVVHLKGAGENARAAQYARKAAARALRAQAPSIAANHLAVVLELANLSAEERVELLVLHGETLRQAGRLHEAASAYRTAASCGGGELPPRAALYALLGSRALACLLHAGEMEQAAALTSELSAFVGISMPRGKARTMMVILYRYGALLLRGNRLPRPTRASADDALRLQTINEVVSALSITEPLQGLAVHLQALREAFRAGDPVHLVPALCDSARFMALLQGAPKKQAFRARLELARRIAAEHGSPADQAHVEGMLGLSEFLAGTAPLPEIARRLWAASEAREQVQRGTAARSSHALLLEATGEAQAELSAAREHWSYRAPPSGEHQLQVTSDIYRVVAMDAWALAGDFGALRREFPRVLQHARDRGNEFLYNLAVVHYGIYLFLALDQPHEARSLLDSARLGDAPVYHLLHARLTTVTKLYEGDYDGAWRVMRDFCRGPHRAAVAAGPIARAVTSLALLLGGLALSGISAAGEPGLAAQLRREMRALRRVRPRFPIAYGFYAMAEAAHAHRAGLRGVAIAKLREALPRFDAFGGHLWTRPIRMRLAQLTGGAAGEALRAQAVAEMQEQGIVDAERFTRCVLPFGESASPPPVR